MLFIAVFPLQRMLPIVVLVMAVLFAVLYRAVFPLLFFVPVLVVIAVIFSVFAMMF
jgi:hypothetical protein